MGIEGLGEAVTGGMIARAVEPEAGEGIEGPRGNCLNCGAALVGDYCHRCGQKARVHRTLSAWWHDFLHSVLHLDGKFWRTLPMLAWRPGELTRRYVEGERARFVSPLALFLFSVFLMFAVFSFVGTGMDPSGVQAGIEEESRAVEARAARLERERDAAAAAGQDTQRLDRRIAAAREEASQLRELQEQGIVQGSAVQVSDDLPPWLQSAARKAGENPSLLMYKIQANAYKFSWALIPISVPFVWLLFLHRGRYRREYKAYDHLVFVTYSIAFMSLVFIGLTLLRAAGVPNGVIQPAFLLIPPVHMYRQLRGAYRLSRPSAGWRTFVLLFFAGTALTLFFLLLLAIGLLG